ncbi:MAG TPA: protein kinase [Gemmatimonadaceae bacterium]
MDLRQRVQDALSGSYTIERELGGGGMSRVFVADEHRFGRKVVVKVLAPELAAAISAGRFEREIRLAASLQQANIVPVLSAGDMDGLPYFTMPYVEGESLRARLGRGGVAIPAAVDILRDVAKALSYAHERGIVHRDIKPDNILLSGGTAVVTDFGIAKAIAAAQEQASSATLTQLGTSVGTPAYMAPEQAAGDPGTDHRADVYAFGCTAYELLAGRPPFHGLPPHKLMAAHMGESPQPLQELRPDCPPALARLVMQCLEKDPAHRPASAEELLRHLDSTTSFPRDAAPAILLGGRGMLLRALGVYALSFAAVALVAWALVVTQGLPDWVLIGALVVMALGLPVILFTGYSQWVAHRMATATPTLTPQGTLRRPEPEGTIAQLAVKASPHMSWRRASRGGAIALGVFATIVAGFLVLRTLGIGPAGSLLAAGKLSAQDQVLVASFDGAGRDSALADVVSEAVRTNLSQSRAVHVVPTSTVVAALQRMQRAATDRVTLGLGREIAVREGIKAVIGGSIASAGEGFIITTRLVNAESGDELASYHEAAANSGEIIPAVDRLTRKLRGKIGESLKLVRDAPPLGQVTTPSLDALRAYAAGLRANDVEVDYTTAINRFEEAIARDSGFAAAYVQLAYSLGNAGLRPARRDSMMTAAFRLRERLPERERYAVEGAYYTRVGRDRTKAIASFERAVALDSSNADAWNSLAILYSGVRDYPRAERAYRRALALEPANAVVQSNLAGTLAAGGKLAGLDSLVDAMLASKSPAAVRWEAGRQYLRGHLDSSEAVTRAGIRSGNPSVAYRMTNDLRDMLLIRGRLREADSLTREIQARRTAQGDAPDMLGDALRSAFDDAWLRGRPQAGLAKADAALAAHPLGPLPSEHHFNAIDVYVAGGAPAKARAILASIAPRLADPTARKQWYARQLQAEGEIAVAEGRTDDAIAAFRRSDRDLDGLPSNCATCLPVNLGLAYDRAGNRDSTIAALERYLATTAMGRVGFDTWFLAPALKRLGELHEERGDAAKAASYYTRFLETWKRADPELQPKVAEVRARLVTLQRKLPR